MKSDHSSPDSRPPANSPTTSAAGSPGTVDEQQIDAQSIARLSEARTRLKQEIAKLVVGQEQVPAP